MATWTEYSQRLAEQARRASRQLAVAPGWQKNDWLKRTADALIEQSDRVLAANGRDLEAAPGYGLTSAAVNRLTLTASSLAKLADALRDITLLTDPVGEVLDSSLRPNGLRVSRVRVPLGVVFFIYESRPNVTLDAAALCVKSGNAVILRGGKEALHSNLALHAILQKTLTDCGLPGDAVQMVDTPDREVVGALLKQNGLIDVAIPRGGKGLIARVMDEATMPVIKHFDGVCHVYVDATADVDMAVRILENSKCQRPGVCNAAECVLVHASIADSFLPRAATMLQENGVQVRGCEQTRRWIPWASTATEEDYRTEYLDLILSARVVSDLDAAMDHIDQYGSHHTETIVTRDLQSADRFVASVDSAAVMVNASTRFNDGGEFGLGAEIGISTDKFHARGPCGLRELTSYKWVAHGNGQIRP